ncbi:ATP-binding protein [Nocardioides sp. CN2-186]|uniref:ATP-binding protein n=1 Tax=Nocardioides tweenelious TaxID=3156607 RepID=UPI0032B398F6
MSPGWAVAFAALIGVLAVAAERTDYPEPGFTSAVPIGGVAVLWFLLRGARVLSIETLVLAAVAYGANTLTGAEPQQAGVFTATTVVQTLLAVVLLRAWCPQIWGCGGERALDRPRALARFGAALVIAMAVGAILTSVGITALTGDDTTMAGLLWFGRNLCSACIIVTFGLLLGQRLRTDLPRRPLLGDGTWAELVAMAAFTVAMYVVAFSFEDLPIAFPLLAATVWCGLRFSTVFSAGHSLVIGLATLGLTMVQIGPFASVDRLEFGYLLAEFYIATMVITGLGLSTGRDERQSLADELRRAQEEAEYSERIRSAVIGSMTEGVLVVDETGELLMHNEAAAQALGVDGEPLTTGSRLSLSSWSVDGVLLSDAERPTARALRGETVQDTEIMIRVADSGESRILNVSAIPLPRDERLNRARALLLLRDTTSEHAHREELSAFAGVVAHDLRNPLAAIDGWTEMIADELDAGALDAQLAREFVSRVRSASRRMRELIRDLLAHATSNARDLDVSRTDVTAIAAEIVAARHAEGFVSVEPVSLVLADPVLVRQVLDNLVGNAVKYVAPGEEPKIMVRGCRSDARLVTIEVVDHGIGVPDGDREKIFDEFHRAHYREYEGSGLGLSIVRRIINRHGGTIEALPNPAGQGSIFRFTLPAYDA